mgnify:CR=1 FL=1
MTIEEKRYTTIARAAEIRFEEKKSVFIACARRAESEEEARAFLEEQRKRFPDANHHVYAWRIGGASEQYLQRFSDDGEPSGTSGPPVLDVLRKGNITDTVIVVTRYFGGIHLGTGGLVKAYGSAASAVMRAAGFTDMIPARLYRIRFPYRFVDIVQHRLERGDYAVEAQEFAADVSFLCRVPASREEEFIRMIEEITGGQAETEKGEAVYFAAEKKEDKNGHK